MGHPRYILENTAIDDLITLRTHLDSEFETFETLMFSDLEKVAENPETEGDPLDHKTLEVIREHLSQDDFDLLMITRFFHGKVCTLRWYLIEHPHRGKVAAFYRIKQRSDQGQEAGIQEEEAQEPEEPEEAQDPKEPEPVSVWIVNNTWKRLWRRRDRELRELGDREGTI